MALSVFDIFKIGIGPSSSHTVGPMNAARQFVLDLDAQRLLDSTHKVAIQLDGSRALTGQGHCTDRAVLLGLEGHRPDEIEPDTIESTVARIRASGRLKLLGRHEIEFDEPLDLLYHRNQVLPGHSNGMRFDRRRVHSASRGGGRGGRESRGQGALSIRVGSGVAHTRTHSWARDFRVDAGQRAHVAA